jgi:hypothetical protein
LFAQGARVGGGTQRAGGDSGCACMHTSATMLHECGAACACGASLLPQRLFAFHPVGS